MRMNQQRGSTLMGLIVGLVLGLAVALGVAIYVTKVSTPFMNKGQIRSADHDAIEAEKNKDWDPNAPLYSKKSQKTPDSTDVTTPEVKPEQKIPPYKPDLATKIDPKSPDPVGDLVKAKTAEPVSPVKTSDIKPAEVRIAEVKPIENKAFETNKADPFIYYVQVGAYNKNEEAEAQRAKLALLGLEAKVSERDQGGRAIYRVRVGPLDKSEANRVGTKLDANNIDSALVRVQR